VVKNLLEKALLKIIFFLKGFSIARKKKEYKKLFLEKRVQKTF